MFLLVFLFLSLLVFLRWKINVAILTNPATEPVKQSKKHVHDFNKLGLPKFGLVTRHELTRD